MKRWSSAGGMVCSLLLLASCNTFDEPSNDDQAFIPPSFRGQPPITSPGFRPFPAGVGGAPAGFAGSGAGAPAGFAGAAASGTGGAGGAGGAGGWMIIDAGVVDDGGADDAGR